MPYLHGEAFQKPQVLGLGGFLLGKELVELVGLPKMTWPFSGRGCGGLQRSESPAGKDCSLSWLNSYPKLNAKFSHDRLHP